MTGWPRYSSAACFSFCRIIAEISGGEYSLPLRVHARVAVAGAHDLVRHHLHLFVHLVELAAHEALDREHGVLGVGDGLPLRDLADEPLARLGERHDRRRQAAAFRVGDDDRLAAFHDRDDGVGGAEVDADDFAHSIPLDAVLIMLSSIKIEWLIVNLDRPHIHA